MNAPRKIPRNAAALACLLSAACLAAPTPFAASDPDQPSATPPPHPLTPVPFSAIKFTDDFWAPRQKLVRERTLPHNLQQCEATGRIENLRLAGAGKGGKFQGYFFNDSDVYKVIEGAAYQLALAPDPALERTIDDLIAVIAKAQQPDGYLDSYFILNGLDKRWTDEANMHETYCAGHLIEAAVAHFQATGKRSLLEVAIKLADHIDSAFGPGKRAEAPGHEEVELALIKLAQTTGDQKYFKLAQFFLDQRGVPRPDGPAKGRLYGEYCQDHIPIRDQTEIVGHAVRAMYLYCAVADVARITHDQGYLDATESVWEDLTQRKMYVTGGVGPSASNEGFTTPFDLPNDSAYAESCASIGLALWSHRLTLLHAESRYFDTFERVLYNGVLSSMSQSGDRFFYVNPLASEGKHHRQEWFGCACCPPNILRFFSSLGGYAYATDDSGIYVNLFASSTAIIHVNGQDITLSQKTNYPWDGKVTLVIDDIVGKAKKNADIALRIPEWCPAATLKVDDQPHDLHALRGYAHARTSWHKGSTIELTLAMPVQRVYSHTSVKANLGRVALQRGPIVYCLEGIDNPAGVVSLVLPPNAQVSAEPQPNLLGGITVLRGKALITGEQPWPKGALYASRNEPTSTDFTAVPYFAWDNRAPGAMSVWLAESPAVLLPSPPPATAASASHCAGHETVAALNDGLEPTHSDESAIPRLTFWDHKGTKEWVQYDFRRPRTIGSTSIYWFDDSTHGGCKPPAAWRVLYKDGAAWKPVKTDGSFETDADRYNTVRFEQVRASAIKVEIDLRPGWSGGILEWKVDR